MEEQPNLCRPQHPRQERREQQEVEPVHPDQIPFVVNLASCHNNGVRKQGTGKRPSRARKQLGLASESGEKRRRVKREEQTTATREDANSWASESKSMSVPRKIGTERGALQVASVGTDGVSRGCI